MHGESFPIRIDFVNKPKDAFNLKINIILKHYFDAEGNVTKITEFQTHRRKIKKNVKELVLQILLTFPHIGVFKKSFKN